jgi:cell division transport system permease protein
MRRSWAVTAIAVLTISVALAILGAFGIVAQQLRGVSSRLGAQLAVSVYLEDEVDAAAGAALAERVAAWPEVAGAEHWTSDRAMAAFRADLGDDAVILEGLSSSVLPASIEVTVGPEVRAVAQVRELADRAGTLPGVREVRFGEERLERLQLLSRLVEGAFVVLGAALLLATLFIVANTVRLTVFARREEIEVLRLVGATGTFVRAPFVIEGVLQGGIGAVLAWGWLAAVEGALRVGLERMLRIAYGTLSTPIELLPWLGPLLAFGLVLGALGSVLAVGRFLRS